jgi:ATP-dependent DNA ligase
VKAKSVVLGTIDFAFSLAPDIFGMVLGNYAKRITKLLPTGLLLLRRRPLFLRKGHVPSEHEFVRLEDTNKSRLTKFVIQEHKADRAGRHFDLRIVHRRRAVSWAIPMKGSRRNLMRFPREGEKWLAVRQPDHNLAYMDFEGTIPSGLGKGTVKIWTSGMLDLLKIEDGNVHLKILEGPASGSYVLVSTNGHLGLILGKAPVVLIPWEKPKYKKEDIEKVKDLATRKEIIVETKVDGAALEVTLGDKSNTITSHRISKKTGKLINHSDKMPDIRDAKHNLAGTILRVEGVHRQGVNFLSGLLNSKTVRSRDLQKKYGKIELAVFDILKYKGKDVSSLPYRERRVLYEKVCKDLGSKIVRPVESGNSSKIARFYEIQVNRKDIPTDGIVIKDANLAFNDGPTIKVKPDDTVDCRVLSVNKSGILGNTTKSLIVETPDGHHVLVGSGFSTFERDWIWDHRKQVIGEVARVTFHVRHGITTATGPRFDSWHPDKSSDIALAMYADLLNVNPYALKSA